MQVGCKSILHEGAAGTHFVVFRSKKQVPAGMVKVGPQATPAVELQEGRSSTGRTVKLAPNGLLPGAKMYVDQKYVVKSVPSELLGEPALLTADADRLQVPYTVHQRAS